jgi:hypothetical protein
MSRFLPPLVQFPEIRTLAALISGFRELAAEFPGDKHGLGAASRA